MMAISRRLKVLDLLLLMGFILPLSLCVGELVTPALADFLDHCPKDCNCKWANGKREADCTRAGFTAVPTHLDHEIQILRMTHNYVRVLGKEVFEQSGLVNLQRIFMNHCHVQEIHWAAFRNLRILVELDLSYNNLTHLQPETFAGNERLQTLTLSHNKIAALSPYVFPYIKHLKSIDLSHNYIEAIQRNTFENLGNSVESLNVDNNRLSTLREEVFLPLTNLKSLQLHSNPWNCDCHLKNFRDWVVFRGLYTYPTSCAEPERLADKLWQDVDPKDFACKPDIQVPQSVVFSQPGANVTLSCFIIGNPMPDAKWVLKGRIVNNNTVPSGGPVSPPQVGNEEASTLSSTTTVVTTPWSMSSPSSESSENLHQNTSARDYKVGPTQFLIHEEGGLERWFNLTITNVGLESVADYTCVAVNAGGVMEEAITLTFEEPEPVGLPGGKKESQESNIGVIVGAAAGGIFFAFVLLFLLLCCCCCRRRVKKGSTGSSLGVSQSSTSNSSSQGGACGPEVERHGSIVGFADSSQKLLPSSSSPMQRGGPHHHQRYAKAFASASITSPELKSSASQSSRLYGMVGGRDETNLDYRAFPAPPPPAAAAQCDMEILSSSSSATLGGERGGGSEKTQNYVELQPVVRSPTGAPRKTLTMVTSSTGESFIPDYPDLLNIQQPQPPHSPKSQPLNPAALVIPPTPPAQFPHQFQHLIHTKPKNSHVLVSPLLSPPAQFSSETNENKSRGYVTLPRKLTASSTSSSRGPIDWSTMSDRPPIYDGVGPRTSATGGTQRPALPDLEAQPKRSASLKRFPAPASSNGEKRDSSGSEVTLGGEDSLTAYIEPFGKAMPPLTSNNHKNTCNPTRRPDSIASAVDSDLEAIVCGDGPFATSKSSTRRKSCPVHKNGPKIIAIPADHSSPPPIQVSKAPKQLKGILKASCKSNITTNPFGNSSNSESSASGSDSVPIPMPLTDAAVHISKSSSIPKPPQRTSSSMNSKNVSEALHV